MIPDATPENYPQKFVRKSNRGDTLRQNMTSSASSDPELLAAWLDRRHEPAFRMLVARYAGLVRASALRTCENESLAAEAAQLTFITLARKARSLTSCRSLGGWLHQTAVWHARNLLRKARRESRKRDHLQAAMGTDSSHSDAWQNLAPALDDALGSLSAADREALLLRFYRALSISEVAAVLGIAAEAARKRIDRALERLRGKLARRGVAPGVSLGAVMLAGFANDAQAASGMVPALTTKALAAGAGGAAAVPMSLTAKAACVALPASVMFGGALWLAAQKRSIEHIRDSNALMEGFLTRQIPSALESRKAVNTSPLSRNQVDWAQVAALFREGIRDEHGYLSICGLMEAEFTLADRNTLIAWLAEIDKANISGNDREILVNKIAPSLVVSDPGFVAERYLSRVREERWTQIVTTAITSWADRDAGAATDWLLQRMSDHGSLPLPIVSPVFRALVVSGSPKTQLLLEALPESDRAGLLRFFARAAISNHELQSVFADLVRQHIPENGRGAALLWPFDQSDQPVPHCYASSDVSEYFERIDATNPERATCLLALAEKGTFPRESGNCSDTKQGDLKLLRAWVSECAPDLADRAVGKALAGSIPFAGSNWQRLVELAKACRDEAGSDQVLTEALDSINPIQFKDPFSAIAMLLTDESQRSIYLGKIK